MTWPHLEQSLASQEMFVERFLGDVCCVGSKVWFEFGRLLPLLLYLVSLVKKSKLGVIKKLD